MKIQCIKPKNTTLKDLKNLRKHGSRAESKKCGYFGVSKICYSPETKFENIVHVDNGSPMPETRLDKFLNKLDDFSEPIVISKEEMKDYAKQVAKKIASWKKIFG